MASTNKTSNLELSQFIATDTPTWLVDYNGDMEKIDTGVGRVEELAQTASTQAVGVASGLQTTNQTVTTLSGQVANVQNQANSNTASVNGINQRLGNTDISGVGDGTITGAINAISAQNRKLDIKYKGFTLTVTANSSAPLGYYGTASKADCGLSDNDKILSVSAYSRDGYPVIASYEPTSGQLRVASNLPDSASIHIIYTTL